MVMMMIVMLVATTMIPIMVMTIVIMVMTMAVALVTTMVIVMLVVVVAMVMVIVKMIMTTTIVVLDRVLSSWLVYGNGVDECHGELDGYKVMLVMAMWIHGIINYFTTAMAMVSLYLNYTRGTDTRGNNAEPRRSETVTA